MPWTGHIEVMHETGDPVPDPSALEEVMSNPDFQDGVAFLVSAEEPGETVRVNITLTSRTERDRPASTGAGDDRSAFLVKAGLKVS